MGLKIRTTSKHTTASQPAIEVSYGSPKLGYALCGAALALGLARGIPGARELLPEPFDLFQHTGNIPASSGAAYLASLTASRLAVHFGVESKLGARLSGLAAALVFGGVISAAQESQLLFPGSNSDISDIAYATVFATGCGAVPNITIRRE